MEAKTTKCIDRKNRNITYPFKESAYTLYLHNEEQMQHRLRPVKGY